MTARMQPRIALRRVDATVWAMQRLARLYGTDIALEDGIIGQLRLHVNFAALPSVPDMDHIDTGNALAVSTRFGRAFWFDYAALLLAFTGVGIDCASTSSARMAFARHAVAALPAALQSALGDPVVCAPHDRPARDGVLAHLRCELPSMRLAMRLFIEVDSLQAMLDDGPWCPIPAAPPNWLAALPSQLRVAVGEVGIPPQSLAQLRRGDVVRLPTSQWDTAGHGDIRIFNRRVEVRWLTDQRCFEVQRMFPDRSPPNLAVDAEAPPSGLLDTAELPVRLRFSLGTLTLTLGDVAAIRGGTLLRLEGGLPPSVHIEANGVLLGYGELVDLDGHLAVEVTDWPQAAAKPQPPHS